MRRASNYFLKFDKNYYVDKLHWNKSFTTLERYVQEIEFRFFEVHCITLSAHFVKTKRNKNQGRSQDFLKGGVTLCQSEGTHQIVIMAKISSWHFRHLL